MFNIADEPHFPRANEDAELLGSLDTGPIRPVFIMGLHRSGTTFLYDTLARCFPFAQLTLYHLFYYRRLLYNQQHGVAEQDRQRLNAAFAAAGIADRGIDETRVEADSVEEYGFLLRQCSGSFQLLDHNATLFDQMCRKLLAVQPGSEAVLLKNPWDTGNAEAILARFPQARFIYISREPLSVLNSMLNALLSYLDGPQPYLEMLLSPEGNRRSYRLGYCAWRLLRLLRRVLGARTIALLHRRLLAGALVKQLAAYRRDLAALPADRAVELDYGELVADPDAVMQRLQPWLGVSWRETPQRQAVRQRHQLNPVLVNYQATLDRLVAAS